MRTFLILILPLLLFTGCADSVDFTLGQYTEPVGFWYGLWHGIIAVIAFIVSLFDDSVAVYAVYNNGAWYDFGFLIGVIIVWSGGSHTKCKFHAEKKYNKEWEEVGSKVEAKVMRKLKAWAEDEEIKNDVENWEEIGDKVEQKLKRKIREWAEKE